MIKNKLVLLYVFNVSKENIILSVFLFLVGERKL